MIKKSKIQSRILEAIVQSGMSQAEIAKQVGVSQSCISLYYKCDTSPSVEILANLCMVLDLDPAYILCLQD